MRLEICYRDLYIPFRYDLIYACAKGVRHGLDPSDPVQLPHSSLGHSHSVGPAPRSPSMARGLELSIF